MTNPAAAAAPDHSTETTETRTSKATPDPVHATATAAPGASSGRLRLATTVLLHPDSSLDRFLAKDFSLLRRMCEHITLYADHTDGASPGSNAHEER